MVAEEDAGGYRYRLLEPVRQYARERLAEAGEATASRRAIAPSTSSSRSAADPEGAAAGRRRARPARGDTTTCAPRSRWALRHEPERALRLAVRMWPIWMAGSHFQEGSRWLDAALAAAPAPTALRAEALRAACGLEIRRGRTGGLSELGHRAGRDLPGARRPARRRPCARRGRRLRVHGEPLRPRRAPLRREPRARRGARRRKVAAAVLHSVRRARLVPRRLPGRARGAARQPRRRLRELPADDRDRFFRVHTVGLFAPATAGRAPRMYFEETVQFFRRVDARRASPTCSPRSATSRAPGADASRRASAWPRASPTSATLATRWARRSRSTGSAPSRGATGRAELGARVARGGAGAAPRAGRPPRRRHDAGQLGVLAARAGDLERGRVDPRRGAALFEATDDAPGRWGAAQPRQPRRRRGELDRARKLLEAAGRWRVAATAARARDGRRSRSPSWRSPTATPSARPSCSTRRSSGCARWATRGVARGAALDKPPLSGR